VKPTAARFRNAAKDLVECELGHQNPSDALCGLAEIIQLLIQVTPEECSVEVLAASPVKRPLE
jgi:hypothetical protein